MGMKTILNRKLEHDCKDLREYDTFKKIIKLFVENVNHHASFNGFNYQWMYLPELGKIIRNEFKKSDVKIYKDMIIDKYFNEIATNHYANKKEKKRRINPDKPMF